MSKYEENGAHGCTLAKNLENSPLKALKTILDTPNHNN
ncbi:hypothetical protein PPIS_b0953 [Pseudoalteromonas piscicida]|uniref:Uncharacterized protein n=1 Tax=Pseudoalteromonas piscicida TaxID=43662 RepID=A0ABN5CRW3_PSEO7|nr:hypothetical protein PPIS_b0953 [Pseudoalteromonas piscicida]